VLSSELGVSIKNQIFVDANDFLTWQSCMIEAIMTEGRITIRFHTWEKQRCSAWANFLTLCVVRHKLLGMLVNLLKTTRPFIAIDE
jgi:hypothetical protein